MTEFGRQPLIPELYYRPNGESVIRELRSTRSVLGEYKQVWQEVPMFSGEMNEDTVAVAGRIISRVRDNIDRWSGLQGMAYHGLFEETKKRGVRALSDQYDELARREAGAFTEHMNPIKDEIDEDLRIVKGLDSHVLARAFTEHVLTDEEIEVIEANKRFIKKAEEIDQTLGDVNDPLDPEIKTLIDEARGTDPVFGVRDQILGPLEETRRSRNRIRNLLFPKDIVRDDDLRQKQIEVTLITLLGEKHPVEPRNQPKGSE